MFDEQHEPVPDEVGLKAAEWVSTLQRAENREPLREPFEAWLAADPVHHRVFREMRIAWAFGRLVKSGATRAEKEQANAILWNRCPLFGTH